MIKYVCKNCGKRHGGELRRWIEAMIKDGFALYKLNCNECGLQGIVKYPNVWSDR